VKKERSPFSPFFLQSFIHYTSVRSFRSSFTFALQKEGRLFSSFSIEKVKHLFLCPNGSKNSLLLEKIQRKGVALSLKPIGYHLTTYYSLLKVGLFMHSALTPRQKELLLKAGITSLYALVTIIPYKVTLIKPLSSFSSLQSNQLSEYTTQYILNARLISKKIIPAGKQFIKLQFNSVEHGLLSFNLFIVAKYTYGSLLLDRDYQLLVVYKNGFLNILQYSLLKEKLVRKGFILGMCDVRAEYINVSYNKQGVLTNSLMKQIYLRLKPEDFLLNLEGLAPDEILVPKLFNFSIIHFPESLKSYQESVKKWRLFQAYLYVCVMKFSQSFEQQSQAELSKFDPEYYTQLIKQLPYKLTESQSSVVSAISKKILYKE
jgi:RecG-like helicase